ncbi:hypothetical protein N0O92_01200 [Alkalihalobacillus sp. MEB130]|uniref:hypothetical protein n=1 Tax=Alkalihalobacillus sp. MEB130 TaxID=2976704 RepID=UPI0028DE6D2D|nr:hypothetical protein [Alkalihalobacillus sp. MEB130]MDT8858826.1 hypothetical protein [Alkalihalobacillus sp. MEB130]
MKNKLSISIGLILLILLTGCRESISTEEVYDRGLATLEDLETVFLDRTQTIRAQQNSFRTSMEADVQFEPLEFYGTVQMSLLDLREPLHFDMYVNDEEWLTLPEYHGATWETNEREQFEDVVLEDLPSLLAVFKPYRHEFLMKGVDVVYTDGGSDVEVIDEDEEVELEEGDIEQVVPAYEVSFRGSDEKYKPLIRTHLEQMNLSELQGVDLDSIMDTVEIERIDMIIQVAQDSFDVLRFQTRFRYLVEVLDEFHVIDESVAINLRNHNEPIDFEKVRDE